MKGVGAKFSIESMFGPEILYQLFYAFEVGVVGNNRWRCNITLRACRSSVVGNA